MYNSRYSNRVLKNVIEPEKAFGCFYYYDETLDEILKFREVKFKQFKAGTKYDLNEYGEGVLNLKFNDVNLFNELIEFSILKPLMFQIYLDDEINANIGVRANGLFYFFTKVFFSHDPKENEFIREIDFLSFSSLFENGSIAEHTKEYDYDLLPVDEQGNKIIPEDYNLVTFKSKTFNEIVVRLWHDNLIATPVNRIKGGFHDEDLTRRVKGVQNFQTTGVGPEGLITYTSSKKSVLEIRKGIVGVLRGQGEYSLSTLEIKLTPKTGATDKIKLFTNFIFRDPIILENGIIKDNYTFISKEVNQENDLVDILIENNGADDLSYREKIGVKSFQWKTLEGLGSATVEEGGTASDLKDNAREIAGNNEIIDTTNLEIDFNEMEYFVDLLPGMVLEMIGYSGVINGKYLIKKMSCIFEQTHLSYAIDEIERIEGSMK